MTVTGLEQSGATWGEFDLEQVFGRFSLAITEKGMAFSMRSQTRWLSICFFGATGWFLIGHVTIGKAMRVIHEADVGRGAAAISMRYLSNQPPHGLRKYVPNVDIRPRF
jgi:hypothetical protein